MHVLIGAADRTVTEMVPTPPGVVRAFYVDLDTIVRQAAAAHATMLAGIRHHFS